LIRDAGDDTVSTMTFQDAPAYIFDLDGTLADTMPLHYQAWLDTQARFGFSFPEDEFYSLGGVPTHTIIRMLVKRAGLDVSPDVVEAFKEAAFVRHLDTPGRLQPVAPVVAIAREIHQAGRPMAIASGGTRKLVGRTLDAIDVRSWFDVVVTSEDTLRHKPNPDVFLEAARRLGVAPQSCTVYEDSESGLEAARRAEMRSVDVRTLFRPRRLT